MVERDVLIGGSVTAPGGLVGGVGVAVQQGPQLIDDRIRPFDTEPGQTGIRPAGRNRVAPNPPGRHLSLVAGIGVSRRRPFIQVLLDQSSGLVGFEPTGPVQEISRNLARGFVGGPGERIDAITGQRTLQGLGAEPGIGRQSRGSACITIERPLRPPAWPARKMSPSAPSLGTSITVGTRQPGNRHQPLRLQPLLETSGQRHEHSIADSGHVGKQRIEPEDQLLPCGYPSGTAARFIQHFHIDNTNQVV